MLHTRSPLRRRVALTAATLFLPFALSGCAVIGVASAATSVATTGASLAVSGASLALSGAALAVETGIGVARLTGGAAGLARDLAAANGQNATGSGAAGASMAALAPAPALASELTLTPELAAAPSLALTPELASAPAAGAPEVVVESAPITAVD